MLLLWSLLALQTSEVFPEFSAEQKVAWFGILGWIDNLGKWCYQKEMSEICWQTFCAVCAAFLVEGFIKALDGMGAGFPINNGNPNTSPFNLVGYAFLLHVYSSPVTHTFTPDGGASRPDKHAIITIGIPLLQLTIFHVLSISKRLSTHRLFPTALTSLLSLAHFHGTLFSHQLFKVPIPTPSATISDTTSTPQVSPHQGRSSVNYPLLNYIPNVFETFLIAVILTTIFLNVVMQLLVRGRVDRVLSGLGVGQGTMLHDEEEDDPGFFQSLPLEEDFGVLLLRVGIASMEATGLRGWGNEVAPINLPVRFRGRDESGRDASNGRFDSNQRTHGMIRLGREQVGEVYYGSASRSASEYAIAGSSSSAVATRTKDLTRRRKKKANSVHLRGFNNDIRTVDLGNSESGSHNHRGFLRYLKEVWMFLVVFWGVLRGLVVFLIERAKGSVRMRESASKPPVVSRGAGGASGSSKENESDGEEVSEEEMRRKEKEIYQRFLRGEDISDDEEDEDDDDNDSLYSDEDEESDDGEGADDNEREAEAVGLFTDFIRNSRDQMPYASRGISTGSNGEMVLAHLMHGNTGASPSPLTRRKWNALVRNDPNSHSTRAGSPAMIGNGEDDDDGFWEIPPPTRTRNFNNDQNDGRLNNAWLCVICAVKL
ncbi:hypothetical protein JR316_0003944 [Psilocybe cubensis]|nr:hypothetical protein JR316_0003944 [Psilocybe cubensis]KAH9484462.1 hypothetical protein JR316_0003944 [Psilocybe cubensis]